jgi:hypothetical protein
VTTNFCYSIIMAPYLPLLKTYRDLFEGGVAGVVTLRELPGPDVAKGSREILLSTQNVAVIACDDGVGGEPVVSVKYEEHGKRVLVLGAPHGGDVKGQQREDDAVSDQPHNVESKRGDSAPGAEDWCRRQVRIA